MKILVIEDDIIQNNNLVNIIKSQVNDIEVLSAYSIEECRIILETIAIDLFFIDINLKDGSGVDLAKGIRKTEGYELTGIVFITTEYQHILDAFINTHCYEFLLKPYKSEDVIRIVDLFYKNKSFTLNKESKYSFLQLENGVKYKLKHEDIIFVEYLSRKCLIHTINGSILYSGYTLSKLLDEIGSATIVQTHKSFIINTKYIFKIVKQYRKLWDVHFNNNDKVALLSLSYKDNIAKELGEFNVD